MCDVWCHEFMFIQMQIQIDFELGSPTTWGYSLHIWNTRRSLTKHCMSFEIFLINIWKCGMHQFQFLQANTNKYKCKFTQTNCHVDSQSVGGSGLSLNISFSHQWWCLIQLLHFSSFVASDILLISKCVNINTYLEFGTNSISKLTTSSKPNALNL